MVGFSTKPNANTAVCHWIMIWCSFLLTKIDVMMYIVQDRWGLLADENRKSLGAVNCVIMDQELLWLRWIADSVQVIQGDIGIHGVHLLKGWELIFFDRVARCTSKCCRRLCLPSSTWILQCSSPHFDSAMCWNHLLKILISFPRAEEIAVTEFGLVQSPKMNVNPINQWELS